MDVSPKYIAEALKRIDARLEKEGENKEAEAARDRERKLEIYDDLCRITTATGRELIIAQPTLGFIRLYRERKSYFEDDEHGLGRLLAALKREKEPGYVRALRLDGDVPDEEADEAMKGVYPEDIVEYYIAIEKLAMWAEEETEKKTMKLLEQRMGLGSGLMERLLKSSSSPATPLTNSSTECTSAPSEV